MKKNIQFVAILFAGPILSSVLLTLVSVFISVATSYTFRQCAEYPLFWFAWAIVTIILWIYLSLPNSEK